MAFRAKGRERLKLQSSSLGAHDSSRSVREGDQLKLQSSSLGEHDSSRSVNLRACAGLPQNRDEPRWEEVEASRSTCLRVGKIPSSMRHQAFRQRILSPKMRLGGLHC